MISQETLQDSYIDDRAIPDCAAIPCQSEAEQWPSSAKTPLIPLRATTNFTTTYTINKRPKNK